MEIKTVASHIPDYLDIIMLRKKADRAARIPKTPGVYYLFDCQLNLLYVGATKKLSKRISEHKSRKLIPFDLIAYVQTDRIVWAEHKAIAHFKPPYNIAGKDQCGALTQDCFRSFYDWEEYLSEFKNAVLSFWDISYGFIEYRCISENIQHKLGFKLKPDNLSSFKVESSESVLSLINQLGHPAYAYYNHYPIHN